LDEINIPHNKYIKNKIFFDDLKSILVDFKAKIISENYSRNESKIIQLRQEITNKNQELFNINEKYSRELNDLKKYNDSQESLRTERMKNLTMLVKIHYEKTIEKIKIFTQHSKWTGSKFSNYSFAFENLEDRLEVILRFMNDLIKDYDQIIIFSEETNLNKNRFELNKKELEEGNLKQKDELFKKLTDKENVITQLEKDLNQAYESNKKKLREDSDLIGQLEYEKQKLIEKLHIAEKNIVNLQNSRRTAT